jgi:transposase
MKKTALRVQRCFSEELRKGIVQLIESGQMGVTQAQREYDIGSPQTIYTWLYKYSRNLKKGTRLVMEKDSKEQSIADLRQQVKELQAALGRQTMETDIYKGIVDLASQEFKIDLKKIMEIGCPKAKRNETDF